MVRAIPESRWDEKLDPERFSLREAVAHVVDWEPILWERMKIAAESPGSTITPYDEGQRAIDMNYAATNPIDEAQRYQKERSKTIAFLKSLPADKWDNRVIHPERGEISINDLANMLIGHDHYHLEHLSQLL